MESTPPPQNRSGVLVGLAIVAMLGAAGALLWYFSQKPPAPPPVVVTTPASQTAPPSTGLDLPPIELGHEDAGVVEDASIDATPKIVGPRAEGCPASCTGDITDAVKQAAQARALTARQCYKTALEGNEGLTGDMTLLVRVGTDGQTCSVSVVSDSTGSSKLQQCVKGKMIAGYPKPKAGCVDVRVPISFKQKT